MKTPHKLEAIVPSESGHLLFSRVNTHVCSHVKLPAINASLLFHPAYSFPRCIVYSFIDYNILTSCFNFLSTIQFFFKTNQDKITNPRNRSYPYFGPLPTFLKSVIKLATRSPLVMYTLLPLQPVHPHVQLPVPAAAGFHYGLGVCTCEPQVY